MVPPVCQILISFESKNSTGGVSLSTSGGDAKHKQWLSSFGVERERERVGGHGGARGWCVQLCQRETEKEREDIYNLLILQV